MADLLEYLKWRGDLSFSQDPPNAVDALVFSALSYISYSESVVQNPDVPITLEEAADLFFRLPDAYSRVRVKKDLELMDAVSHTKRFGPCRICRYNNSYIPEQETQFAAVGFLLDDGSAFIAFRGTDYSLVGWKEDFNMSFQQTVPAQRLALQYTREFAMEYMCLLRLGGHSKGGNLAVFAAARCGPMLQSRIIDVYNHDGPGFTEYMIGDPGYLAIVSRIHTFIPQSSVIGMLLEHEEPYTIIKSKQVGLLQHEFYSWEVMGNHFILMEEITGESRFLNMTIKAWIAQMTPQERNVLVDSLFDLLSSGDVESALDIFNPKNIKRYLKLIGSNGDMRRLFSGEAKNLLIAARNARQQLSVYAEMDNKE